MFFLNKYNREYNIVFFLLYKYVFLGGFGFWAYSNHHHQIPTGDLMSWWVLGEIFHWYQWLSSQSDWNTGVCSAEWVLASARLICVAGIDNFGEQPLCWTRLKSTIAHKQFDQNRVQQSVCSRVLANIPYTRNTVFGEHSL